MKNSCGSCKHMRAVDGKQNLQFHWPYLAAALDYEIPADGERNHSTQRRLR